MQLPKTKARAGKRILALTLVICMVLSMFVCSVSAVKDDVSGHWAEKQIRTWVEQGLVNGYSDGTVRPDAAITRGEFCAIVNRVFGFGEAGAISFTDVPESHWAYKQVAIATKVGYMTGLGNGNFGPDKPITRQEMAVVIARLLERSAVAGNGGYTDASDMASWAKGAIAALAEDGTMNGYPDGTFRPEKNVTRAEGIVALSKVAGIEVDEGVLDEEEEEEDDHTGTGSGIVGPGTGSGSGVVPGPGTGGGSGSGSTTPDIPSIPDPKPEVPEQPEQPAEKKDELYSDTTPYGRFLTYNGKAEAQILLPKDAGYLEKKAAQEMQDNLELVTGAKLPINTGVFTDKFYVELAEDVVVVGEMGYYPVTVNVKNFTSKDKLVTLSHANAEAGMPELIIQGSKGLEEGQVEVPVGSTVHVNALLKAENPKAFGKYVAEIDVECDGEPVKTLELEVRAGGNYFDTGDFEASAGSWTGGQRNTAFRMSGEAAFQSTADGNPAYGEKLELSSGSLYLLSFWTMKTEKSDFKVRVRDYDAEGNLLDTPMSLYSTFSASGRWTYYEYRFVANTSGDENYAYSLVDFVGNGELWLDEVYLQYCGETTNTIPEETGEFLSIMPRPIQAYGFPAESDLDEKMLEAGILEYDHIPNWYTYALTHLTQDSYVGDYGCEFYYGTNTYAILTTLRNPIASKLGTYTVSVWAKGAGDGESFVEFRVRHNYVDTADQYSESIRLYPSNEWERYEITFTPAEKDSEYAGTSFQVMPQGATRVDDPTLRKPILLDHITCYNTESASALSTGGKGFKLPAGNLLDEGAFEAGTGSWTGGSVSTDAHAGNSAYATSAAGTMTYNSGDLNLFTGYTSRLGLWLKGETAGKATVAVKDYGSNGQTLSTPASMNLVVDVTTDWTYHELYFTPNISVDADYKYSTIEIVGNGALSVDDVELVYCAETKELVTNGDFEIGVEANVDGTGSQANSDWKHIYVEHGITTFTNFPGWHFSGASHKDTGYAGYGLKSLSPMKYPYSLFVLRYQNLMATTAGKDYVLSFWAKTTADNTTDNTMKVVFSDKTSGGAGEDKTWNVALTDQWQQYQFTFTAGATSNIQNRLAFRPDTDGSKVNGKYRNTFWVDQVSLIEASEPVADDDSDDAIQTMPAQPALDMPQNSGLNILICTDESLPAIKDVFADDLAWLAGTDGFAVRQRGSTIYIFGDNEDGALNGAYDFLEENAGIIWMRAHDTAYKEQPSLATKRTDYREKPVFLERSWHTVGVNEFNEYFYDYDTQIYLRRNKVNAHTANIGGEWAFQQTVDVGFDLFHSGHNITFWLQRSTQYLTDTPENQRDYWNSEDPGFLDYREGDEMDSEWRQVNFWNPKVLSATVEAIREYLDTYPQLTTVGVGLMDSYYFAQEGHSDQPYEYAPGQFVYPDVENQYSGKQMNDQNKLFFSTIFFDWLNKIAVELEKTHPHVRINTTAYYVTEVPPACEIHENINVVFCAIYENLHDSIYDETDTQYNVPTYRNYRAWVDSGIIDPANFAAYNYPICSKASEHYSRPVWDQIQELFKLYAADGLTRIRPDGAVDGGDYSRTYYDMNVMVFWLVNKLMWNPYVQVEDLIEQFCDTVYGDAAPYMLAYHNLLKKGWDEGELDIQWTTATRETYNAFIFAPGIANDVQTALDNALKAVDGQGVYEVRVRTIKERFEETMESLGLLKDESGTAIYTTASSAEILNDFDFENSPIWKDAQVLTNFFNSVTLQPWEGWSTKVRLLWDEEYFYVAYENFDAGIEDIETTDSIVAGWWNGRCDNIETYVTLDASRKSYYQYDVAPRTPSLGAPSYFTVRWMWSGGYKRYDSTPAKWNANLKIIDEEGTERDRWCVIQAISFDSLGQAGPGKAGQELFAYFYSKSYPEDKRVYARELGWNGAPVWNPNYLKPITLLAEGELPPTAEAPEEAPEGGEVIEP